MSRKISDDDIRKYEPMVESYMKKYVQKNWNEASLSKHLDEIALGNTGYTMADIRQHLRTEVFIGLTKYNPDYRTKDGKSVKESTFIFNHLFNRIGQLMKKLTKKRYGYGAWTSDYSEVVWEHERD